MVARCFFMHFMLSLTIGALYEKPWITRYLGGCSNDHFSCKQLPVVWESAVGTRNLDRRDCNCTPHLGNGVFPHTDRSSIQGVQQDRNFREPLRDYECYPVLLDIFDLQERYLLNPVYRPLLRRESMKDSRRFRLPFP